MVNVFLAEGFEEIEALTVVDLLRRAEIEVELVSVSAEREVSSSHNVRVTADKILAEVDFGKTQMIVLPGGMPGTANLEACEPLMAQVENFYRQGKWIGAICAAPSILGHRGYLKGRFACSFPSFESHLDGAKVTEGPVEISGHLITSRGMGTAISFGLAIIGLLKGKEAAQSIADKIVYSGN